MNRNEVQLVATNEDLRAQLAREYKAARKLAEEVVELRTELATAKKRIELLEHLHDRCVACGGSFGTEVPAPVCDGCEPDVTIEKHVAWQDRTAALSESSDSTKGEDRG